MKYFAVFGGGGIRGIAYCGAYKALLEKKVELSGLAGSSIGAVFASLLSLDYAYDEIFEIFSDTGFGLFNDFNLDLKKEIAFSKGQKFFDWIRNHIEAKFYGNDYEKGKMNPVKFSDIKKNLIIYAVDLNKMVFKEFSKLKTPDTEVAYAVRASVSMPGLFTPLIDENDPSCIVDGDLLKSSPLWRFCDTIKNSPDRILEFRLEDNAKKDSVFSPVEYINRVYNAFCGFATDYIIDLYGKKDKFDYIKINTPDISVVDFLISKQKKQELFEIGYNSTVDYFDNVLYKKRNDLFIKYKKILEFLLDFQRSFQKNNYCNSYIKLCEMYVYLFDEKRYIDTTIQEKLSDLKNLFFENYVKSSIFNLNKGSIKDKRKEIYSLLLDSVKLLTEKTEELG